MVRARAARERGVEGVRRCWRVRRGWVVRVGRVGRGMFMWEARQWVGVEEAEDAGDHGAPVAALGYCGGERC